MPPRLFALIPAAGVGQRAGSEVPKQYAELLGKPLLAHAVAAFAAVSSVESIHVVVSPGDEWLKTLGGSHFPANCRFHRVGGATRAQSVLNGLRAMAADESDWVLVHDAARPCITPAMIESLIAALNGDDIGGLLALPVPDTVKRADSAGRVAETISREGLWLAQTPQMFRYGALRAALERFPDVTDEAGAIERMGLKPKLVIGDARNIKVTYPADFALAEAYLKAP
jgi:2-C-methyl-D-erythritol 4-phosphate cytidylyltransferase